MNWWPFRTEHRADYTEAAIAAILRNAGSPQADADPNATAAAQSAAGLVSRSLAVAVVTPDTAANALTPVVLADVGLYMILAGESAYEIQVDETGVNLRRFSDWQVYDYGGRWYYRANITGPSRTETVVLPEDAVFHPRMNTSPAAPHRGRSPIKMAGFTANLLAYTERSLGDEMSAPVGRVLPAPLESLKPGDITSLKGDLANLKGKTALVDSMSKSWGEGRSGAPAGDWVSRRIGGEPPQISVELRQSAHEAVLSSVGMSAALFSTSANANAAREAYRQFLFSVLAPIGDMVLAEVRVKMYPSAQFDYRKLMASDLQGRARSFKSLVDGGMSVEDAARVSGVLMDED